MRARVVGEGADRWRGGRRDVEFSLRFGIF
jgi:hypothetical protein